MPANAGLFMAKITEIAAFDLTPFGDFVNEQFELIPQKPVSVNFEAVGLEDRNFINNVGSFTIIIVIYFLLSIIWALVFLMSLLCPDYIFGYSFVLKTRIFLEKKLFWGPLM